MPARRTLSIPHDHLHRPFGVRGTGKADGFHHAHVHAVHAHRRIAFQPAAVRKVQVRGDPSRKHAPAGEQVEQGEQDQYRHQRNHRDAELRPIYALRGRHSIGLYRVGLAGGGMPDRNPSVSALAHNEPSGQPSVRHPRPRTGLVQTWWLRAYGRITAGALSSSVPYFLLRYMGWSSLEDPIQEISGPLRPAQTLQSGRGWAGGDQGRLSPLPVAVRHLGDFPQAQPVDSQIQPKPRRPSGPSRGQGGPGTRPAADEPTSGACRGVARPFFSATARASAASTMR